MFSSCLRTWRSAALAPFLAAGLITSPASAQVILDTSFLATEGETGYSDGTIVFQQPFGPRDGVDGGPRNGIWLGQNNDGAAGGGPIVDSTNGFVSTGSGSFRRNAWSEGVNGGFLGQGGIAETGNGGFTQGDAAVIEIDTRFTIGETTANQTFFNAGVKDALVGAAFEAAPFAGFEVGYSGFEDGLFRTFTNFGRAVSTPGDQPFALTFLPADAGINNGFDGGPLDLTSDNLRFRYEIELVDGATDTWQATELTVTNLDTSTVLAQATVDNPMSLESFVYNSTAVDNPFTPENEAGIARGDGSDLFFGITWVSGGPATGTAAASSETERLFFEFIPEGGIPAIPGDFNGDGIANTADYATWRDTLGSTTELAADANGNGVVDVADYDAWVLAVSGGAPALSAIPEPSALLLAGLGVASLGFRRRR